MQVSVTYESADTNHIFISINPCCQTYINLIYCLTFSLSEKSLILEIFDKRIFVVILIGIAVVFAVSIFAVI